MSEYCLVLLNYYYNTFEAQLICGDALHEYAMFTKIKLKFGFEIVSKFCKIAPWNDEMNF